MTIPYSAITGDKAMTVQKKEQLIKEKEAEIKKLKHDIMQLRGTEIKTLTKNKLLTGVYISEKSNQLIYDHWEYDIWTHIKNLVQMIYFADCGKGYNRFTDEDAHRLSCKSIKQKEMTQAQRKLSAQFADEVIELFNKYVMKANPVAHVFGKDIKVFGGEE